ncbi:MAG: energy transducer TonB [Aquificaceae bacterium]|nr:energy transducer TonB [Aquificaceae bacterium]MCX8060663.1 energy transducer TonB [Aquificaceae bacterium]MDW8097007.1 energy transducer TonB [Aquificaceae bacterium]
MNRFIKAYFLSLVLHATALLLLSLLQEESDTRPVEVDLSFVQIQKTYSQEHTRPPNRKVGQDSQKAPPSEGGQRVQAKEGQTAFYDEGETEENRPLPSSPPGIQSAPFQSSGDDERPDNWTRATEPQAPREGASEERPPVASPELQRETYLREKLSVISHIVQRSISYPPLARRMGWEGRVVLSIHIKEDGTLKEVKIAESSGYELLDRNAVETVKRVAGLFPKPPVEVVVKLPVAYKLE